MDTPYIPFLSTTLPGACNISPAYTCYVPNPKRFQSDFATRDGLLRFLEGEDFGLSRDLAQGVIEKAEQDPTGVSMLHAGASRPYGVRVERQDPIGFRVVVTQANLGGNAFVRRLKERHRQQNLFSEV